MIREFRYKGESFRVNAHGIPGHEEVFIIHMVDGEEMGEISIDRMTEENDTSAPIDAICVMLCDQLIVEQDIEVSDPTAAFLWVEGEPFATSSPARAELTVDDFYAGFSIPVTNLLYGQTAAKAAVFIVQPIFRRRRWSIDT